MYRYSVYLDEELIEEDYNFDSYSEAESEAGFCINSLLDCGYEDKGYNFYDFDIIVEEQ